MDCSGITYLDDIVVLSKTFDDHLQRVQEMLERIRAAGLTLKPEKMSAVSKWGRFLGHLLSADVIKPNPHSITKVKLCPKSKNTTEV